ncbi:MAG: fumarylacetoacetate hydrolase family protein [bacterium]
MKFWRVLDPVEMQPIDAIERDGTLWRLHHTVADFVERSKTGNPRLGLPFVVLDEHILPPVAPSKIVCIGLNYKLHAEEQGKPIPEEPLIFLKATSALLPNHGTILLPPQSEEVHHEAELAIIIGSRACRVAKEDALEHVLGYTCANDVTARDIQRQLKRYTVAKGFDTFCPLGPAMVPATHWQPEGKRITCRINGEVKQEGTFDDMIFDIATCISYISHIMTLEPGDVILTGTPAGVGPLSDGDIVEVEIEGIGTLSNPVTRL